MPAARGDAAALDDTAANGSWSPGRAVLRELPWLLGVAVGVVLLWQRGYAFQPPPYIASFDWPEYLPSAWMVINRVDAAGAATWRLPGYLALLGFFGERVGYQEAGVYIASVSLCVMVFATGLAARTLANPWAGMYAAAVLPLMKVAAQAARWITLYPCFAAGTVLSLALGACVWRWPRLWLALLAGLACAFTLAMDWRGIQVVPPVLALCALGTVRARGWRRWLLPVVAASVMWLGPAFNAEWQVRETLAPWNQWAQQRNTEIEVADQDGLGALCADSARGSLPSPAMLADPCAQAFLAENARRLDEFSLNGLRLTLMLLPLVLLPGRRGWTGTAASAVIFGTVAAALLVMGLWARLNEHHFFQYASFYVMVPAVGIGRLIDSFPRGRLRSLGRATLFSALTIWNVHYVQAHVRPADDLAEIEPFLTDGAAILMVDRSVGPDDRFMDCSGVRSEVALLPRRFHSALPTFHQHGAIEACQRWLRQPEDAPGDRWVMTDRTTGQNLRVPTDRWERIASFGGQHPAQLWRWVEPGAASQEPPTP